MKILNLLIFAALPALSVVVLFQTPNARADEKKPARLEPRAAYPSRSASPEREHLVPLERPRVVLGTPRDEVPMVFGRPPDVVLSPQIWIYWDGHKVPDPRYQTLIIVFSPEGRVARIRCTATTETRKIVADLRGVAAGLVAATAK